MNESAPIENPAVQSAPTPIAPPEDVHQVLKTIKNLAIASLILFSVGWLGVTGLFIPILGPFIAVIAILTLGPTLIAQVVLNIVSAVKILSSDFGPQVNSIRTLWGVLTIILLGWIAALVFVSKAQTLLNSSTQTTDGAPTV